MISLTIFNHNPLLAMEYMVIIMLIALIGVSPQFNQDSDRGLGIYAVGFLTFIMAIVPIQSGDFIHTGIAFQTGTGLTHYEEIYTWLFALTQNYLVWRIVVFGLTTLLMVMTVKLLDLDKKFAAFIFVITQMFMFGALRNMFGIMLMFFSVSLIFFSSHVKKKSLCIILGALGLFGCTFLHRSMTLYVLLLLLGFIPFGIRLTKISLIVFPFLYGSIFIVSSWIIQNFLPDMAQHAAYYTDSDRGTTVMKTINEILKHSAYLYLLYLVFKTHGDGQLSFPAVIRFLMRYSYVLIYIGFLFCGQATGGWLYERFVWTGEIALMFVMMWFFYNYPRTDGVKICFGVLIYQIIYLMLYVCTIASTSFMLRYKLIQL